MTGQFTPTPSAQAPTTSFTAAGNGNPAQVRGFYNLSLTGDGAGTYKVQRLLPGASAYVDSWDPATGALILLTKTASDTIGFEGHEQEAGVLTRWVAVTHTAGTTVARISQ